jgi:hypothetical protein
MKEKLVENCEEYANLIKELPYGVVNPASLSKLRMM